MAISYKKLPPVRLTKTIIDEDNVNFQMDIHNTKIDIQDCIFHLRGTQVMLDRDLAELYGVPTKRLNEQVKRNSERFPCDYMFTLSMEETRELVANCDRFQVLKHSSVPMNAFTEHGIIMLASVLRSETAIKVSVQITNTFVAMRQMLASMAPLLARIKEAERRQMEDRTRQIADQKRNEERFLKIFDAMENHTFPPQKVFYDGEVFDADVFATMHILSAQKSVLLIDSWVDLITLEMLSKKNPGVVVKIVTSPRGNKLNANDISTFNAQYGGLTLVESCNFHDRFLIIDDNALYLFGASLKDLGKKCFAFTKLDPMEISGLKARI